jgi:hypothetical protein
MYYKRQAAYSILLVPPLSNLHCVPHGIDHRKAYFQNAFFRIGDTDDSIIYNTIYFCLLIHFLCCKYLQAAQKISIFLCNAEDFIATVKRKLLYPHKRRGAFLLLAFCNNAQKERPREGGCPSLHHGATRRKSRTRKKMPILMKLFYNTRFKQLLFFYCHISI